ncbi:MAG: hypothetical protein KDI81_07770 [Xanthomonadales bacterium]|nr:hypothetical protein [Xanthomonadales bacterium]
MSTLPAEEPFWEPLARPGFTPAQTAAIVVRHLIPVGGVFALGWSAGQFLLLSLFDICFSIVGTGMLGALVSTRQEVGPGPDPAGAIGSWLAVLVATLVGSVLLTALFGWVIALFMVSAGDGLGEKSLWISALTMVLAAAPALWRRYRSDLAAGLSEAQRKRRDQPHVLVLVLNAGLVFAMCGFAADFGRFGLFALVVAATALSLLRDLRPDLMRELARPSDMPPPKEYGEAGRNHDFLLLLWQQLFRPASTARVRAKRRPREVARAGSTGDAKRE